MCTCTHAAEEFGQWWEVRTPVPKGSTHPPNHIQVRACMCACECVAGRRVAGCRVAGSSSRCCGCTLRTVLAYSWELGIVKLGGACFVIDYSCARLVAMLAPGKQLPQPVRHVLQRAAHPATARRACGGRATRITPHHVKSHHITSVRYVIPVATGDASCGGAALQPERGAHGGGRAGGCSGRAEGAV